MTDLNEIKINSQIIEGIPCLVIQKEIDQPAPLVFFSHGYESDKRDGIRLGFELAKRGITCVSFDTIWRGDRVNDKLDPEMGAKAAGIYPPETGLDGTMAYFQMIRQSGKDVKTLMDHFREDQRVDPDRIGLSGYSMGGMVALHCAGFFPELSAVAAIAGIAGIENFWHEILLQTRLHPGMPAELKPLETRPGKWLDFIKEMDPIDKLREYPEKPLLLMGGEDDPVINRKYNLDLYKDLRPLYKEDPDRLRMRLFEGITHQFTAKMMIEVAEWFTEVYLR